MKHPIQSRTLWLNLIGFVIIAVQYFGDVQWIKPEITAMILAAANFVLRFFTSKEIRMPDGLND